MAIPQSTPVTGCHLECSGAPLTYPPSAHLATAKGWPVPKASSPPRPPCPLPSPPTILPRSLTTDRHGPRGTVPLRARHHASRRRRRRRTLRPPRPQDPPRRGRRQDQPEAPHHHEPPEPRRLAPTAASSPPPSSRARPPLSQRTPPAPMSPPSRSRAPPPTSTLRSFPCRSPGDAGRSNRVFSPLFIGSSTPILTVRRSGTSPKGSEGRRP